ncbi:MAG: L-aspartate oxidase [Planctomycetes bacterium]|nr:L-aspartate oxidase [Planctomycetota bacterium]
MRKALKHRRYLRHFSSHNVPQLFTDALIIGSGVGGLTTALELPDDVSVLLVSKGELSGGSTAEAQGGIAAAIGAGDAPEQHYQDTLAVGGGLCSEEATRVVTSEASARIKDLIEMGLRFDRAGQDYSLTREGGHRRPRILHANGDATGKALSLALAGRAREKENIHVLENTFALDLLTLDGVCHGALLWRPSHGFIMVRAKQSVLATGGCGRVYRETTNPASVTGDGVAMAFRAGASLQDMEFIQFHPTTLYVAGASRALISESLRGEGGVLRNRSGERFMARYHPDAELAPRDVVSRSIVEEMRQTEHTHVYLDATAMSSEYLENRFPTITALCRRFGLDPAQDMIPVRPAAHYMIGGVRTDLLARTDVKNLFAVGEVACTGLHGANRLGSNSLVEGLVFGRRCAEEAARKLREMPERLSLHALQALPQEPSYGRLNLTDVANSLKSVMWRNAGIVRTGKELDEALEMIAFWRRYVMDKEFDKPQGWELQNMLVVASLITMSARQREESRGAHYRSDFTEPVPGWQRHILISSSGEDWL